MYRAWLNGRYFFYLFTLLIFQYLFRAESWELVWESKNEQKKKKTRDNRTIHFFLQVHVRNNVKKCQTFDAFSDFLTSLCFLPHFITLPRQL